CSTPEQHQRRAVTHFANNAPIGSCSLKDVPCRLSLICEAQLSLGCALALSTYPSSGISPEARLRVVSQGAQMTRGSGSSNVWPPMGISPEMMGGIGRLPNGAHVRRCQ